MMRDLEHAFNSPPPPTIRTAEIYDCVRVRWEAPRKLKVKVNCSSCRLEQKIELWRFKKNPRIFWQVPPMVALDVYIMVGRTIDEAKESLITLNDDPDFPELRGIADCDACAHKAAVARAQGILVEGLRQQGRVAPGGNA